ncbi:MAG: nucleotidyl transferase AbiEii/AbiGii toxin family protein [Phycisphaerales bacterium]|nr:nucleotidyl transferase AbiEii/AbiGii toxin family protein [Phycisphaerales bacterium]
MSLDRDALIAGAAALGFRSETLEKVLRLLELLDEIARDPWVGSRVALKGGTALNLFVFDVPRLSVDIDLNYIGSHQRAVMETERPRLEMEIARIAQAAGMTLSRIPDDHAGGKWRLRYASVLGQGGSVEIDLNFMHRVPLWPVVTRDSRTVAGVSARAIPLVDVHEIAGGKLSALLSRRASRDLFDAHALLSRTDLDDGCLRIAFVAMGAMNRIDWRTVCPESLSYDAREIGERLVPVLRTPHVSRDTRAWAHELLSECRDRLVRVLPLRSEEQEFLDRLLDHGELRPELLTADESLAERLRIHPSLLWKSRNVRIWRRH